jgi:hypothetical protein
MRWHDRTQGAATFARVGADLADEQTRAMVERAVNKVLDRDTRD